MWPELKRKLFHMLALVYVVALVYLPRKLYLESLLAWLVIELIIEITRLKVPAVNMWFIQRFGGLFREHERAGFSGVFWALAGVTTTVAVSPSVPIAATALLYLIFGDAAASLIGKRFGGPHWPGSKKRLSGSAACLVVCLIIGWSVLLPAGFGRPGVIVGAITATVFEFGLPFLNDNFSIPVASAAALLWCYGVRPFV